MPTLAWPLTIASNIYSLQTNNLIGLVVPAIAIALVGFIESISIAKTVAKQEARNLKAIGVKTNIDPTNELFALGMCNLACSVLSGYPVTGSFSRTAVNANSQASSPVASLVAASVAGITLVLLTPVLQYIPKVALAAIVLIAVVKLVHFREGLFLWRVCRRDFLAFALIVSTTLLLGVEISLVTGILTSWLLFLQQKSPVHAFILGRPLDADLGSPAPAFDHIVVVRVGDLRFTSTNYLKEVVETLAGVVQMSALIFDCSNVNIIDGSGVHCLKFLADDLKDRGITFRLASLPIYARNTLVAARATDSNLQSGPYRWRLAASSDVAEAAPPALELFDSVYAAVLASSAQPFTIRRELDIDMLGGARTQDSHSSAREYGRTFEQMHDGLHSSRLADTLRIIESPLVPTSSLRERIGVAAQSPVG
jgi:SulP family sulfate permease